MKADATNTSGQISSIAALADPRESMRRLPAVMQTPLTLLTGKPYTGQPTIGLSASFHVVGACTSMMIGLVVTGAGLIEGGAWILLFLPGVAVTLHGMRNVRMMVLHQAAHKNLFNRPKLDEVIGRTCAAVLLVQNFTRYSSEHTGDHHSRHHMTLRDPTVQAFLIGLELEPGMSRKAMWRRVLRKLVSPRFHAVFGISRIRSFWTGADGIDRAIAVAVYTCAALVATLTGGWSVFIVGWLVPLFPLFQISNTLRLCVKHTFPAQGAETITGKERMASLTNAIFLGEALPARGSGWPAQAFGWARWCTRMMFLHLPARYLVLTGDTVCHDFHHRHPRHKAWFNYISARELDSASPGPGWPLYTEVWGLGNAISYVFDSLNRADITVFDRRQIERVSSRALFTAFDD